MLKRTRVGFDNLLAQLFAVIPEEETELRSKLTHVTKDWWNVAPELRGNDEYWLPIQEVLEECVGPPPYATLWKEKVQSIYNSGGLLAIVK